MCANSFISNFVWWLMMRLLQSIKFDFFFWSGQYELVMTWQVYLAGCGDKMLSLEHYYCWFSVELFWCPLLLAFPALLSLFCTVKMLNRGFFCGVGSAEMCVVSGNTGWLTSVMSLLGRTVEKYVDHCAVLTMIWS